MPDFFLPFLIGYFSARILSYLLDSSTETATRTDTILLRWDKNIFGWRTATEISHEKSQDEKYMVAYPISGDFIRLMKSKATGRNDSAR
tara:strand:+ start:192 stop:458 length:267 start_codon:yes stop_codon:yes gene_type:complete